MMTSLRAAIAGCALLAALAAAAPLAAGDETPDESAYISSLRACQVKTDPAERLACYDTAVAAVVAASSEGEVKVVGREEVRETRRKLFGFALPDFGIFGGRRDGADAGDDAELAALQTTVAAVRSMNGKLVITTAEGAEWQLDELPSRLMRPRIGQPLEIKAGALSSYFLRINGQSGVKGRRVR